jgi:hypothetical protein
VNVVGIDGEGARGRVVDEIVGVVAEEDTRRLGIVGVRERRIEEVEECGGEENRLGFWGSIARGKKYTAALWRLARVYQEFEKRTSEGNIGDKRTRGGHKC